MISEMYSVFDQAVKAFLPPFFARSKGEAIRSFTDACNNKEHQFHRHAADYSLWKLGEFDDNAGTMVPRAVGVGPERIIGALECVDDEVVFAPERATPSERRPM